MYVGGKKEEKKKEERSTRSFKRPGTGRREGRGKRDFRVHKAGRNGRAYLQNFSL